MPAVCTRLFSFQCVYRCLCVCWVCCTVRMFDTTRMEWPVMHLVFLMSELQIHLFVFTLWVSLQRTLLWCDADARRCFFSLNSDCPNSLELSGSSYGEAFLGWWAVLNDPWVKYKYIYIKNQIQIQGMKVMHFSYHAKSGLLLLHLFLWLPQQQLQLDFHFQTAEVKQKYPIKEQNHVVILLHSAVLSSQIYLLQLWHYFYKRF